MALTILDQEVVRHIGKCFTLKGMKTSAKKRNYTTRGRISQGDVMRHLQTNAGEEEGEEDCQVNLVDVPS